MRHNRYSELTRNQESAFYYPDMFKKNDSILQNHPDYRSTFYPKLLVDDLINAIIPYTRDEVDYTVKLITDHPNLTNIISFALDTRDYRGRSNIKESLRSFFNRIIQSLGYYGVCIYEIVELLNPDTSEPEAVTFSFIHPLTIFRPSTIFKENEMWLQYVPVDIAHEHGTKQYIPLSEDRLLIFKFPEQYHKNWMDRIESLANISEMTPSFGLPSLENNRNKVPFDFLEHHKLRGQVVAKLTNDIGWNMRRFPHDGMTEYYWLHRRLLFEKFKIELRESLLATLNNGLIRVGEKLNMHGYVKIEGLSTMDEVEQAQLDLKSGKRSAKELLNQFSV